MHLIDTPNSSAGQFQDANPAVGQQAAFLNAAWCNALQNELATIVTAGGLTLQTASTETADQVMKALVNIVRPLGSQYVTYDDGHTPNMLWPWQSWSEISKGRVVVGRDTAQTEFSATGQTGGEKTHILTVAELPAHHHSLPANLVPITNTPASSTSNGVTIGASNTGDAGGGGAHNNLQPYLVARIWQRTA